MQGPRVSRQQEREYAGPVCACLRSFYHNYKVQSLAIVWTFTIHISLVLPTSPLPPGRFSQSTNVTVFPTFRSSDSHAFWMKSEFSGLTVTLP